jgi:hypothetical protein
MLIESNKTVNLAIKSVVPNILNGANKKAPKRGVLTKLSDFLNVKSPWFT